LRKGRERSPQLLKKCRNVRPNAKKGQARKIKARNVEREIDGLLSERRESKARKSPERETEQGEVPNSSFPKNNENLAHYK